MLKFKGSTNIRRIVVLNPKGGSGKTTLAFNLAGYLACTGRQVALIDMDRQGSSTRWLQNRPSEYSRIHGISVIYSNPDMNGDQCITVPQDIDYVVVDAPGALPAHQLADYTCGAHAIIVPVLPSDLDIHAASRLVSDLLLVAQVSRRNGRLGVIANRVNERTLAYQQLRKFLHRLTITVVAVLRDSQNYTRAASSGLCIHEMPASRAGKDIDQWRNITQWLERRLATPLTPRDMLRPADPVKPGKNRDWRSAVLLPTAAAVALLIGAIWWNIAAEVAVDPQVAEPVVLTDVQTDNLPAAPMLPVNTEPSEEPGTVAAGDRLKQQWQLSGIAKFDGSSVLILNDRYDDSTRHISENADLDGWIVKDAGSDYAVFAQDGDEVRLVLNEEPKR